MNNIKDIAKRPLTVGPLHYLRKRRKKNKDRRVCVELMSMMVIVYLVAYYTLITFLNKLQNINNV